MPEILCLELWALIKIICLHLLIIGVYILVKNLREPEILHNVLSNNTIYYTYKVKIGNTLDEVSQCF